MWPKYHTMELIKTADDTINTKHNVFLYDYIDQPKEEIMKTTSLKMA